MHVISACYFGYVYEIVYILIFYIMLFYHIKFMIILDRIL